MKKVLMFFLMLSLAIFAVGCGDKAIVAETEKNNDAVQVEEQEQPEFEQQNEIMMADTSQAADEQAVWDVLFDTLIGKKEPNATLDADDPKIQDALEVVFEYWLTVENIDYETYSIERMAKHWDNDALESEVFQKEKQRELDEIKQNKLVQEVTSFKFSDMVFTKDFSKCMIMTDMDIEVVSAKDEWLKENFIEKGKTYHVRGVTYVWKEGDKYKIAQIEKESLKDIAAKAETKE